MLCISHVACWLAPVTLGRCWKPGYDCALSDNDSNGQWRTKLRRDNMREYVSRPDVVRPIPHRRLLMYERGHADCHSVTSSSLHRSHFVSNLSYTTTSLLVREDIDDDYVGGLHEDIRCVQSPKVHASAFVSVTCYTGHLRCHLRFTPKTKTYAGAYHGYQKISLGAARSFHSHLRSSTECY